MKAQKLVNFVLFLTLSLILPPRIMAQTNDLSPSATVDKLIYVSGAGGSGEIMRIDSDGSNLLNLTNNAAHDASPDYSPPLDKIAFISDRTGTKQIFAMNADGTNAVNLSNSPTSEDDFPVWSPTGAKIVFVRDGSNDATEDGIWTMNADGSGQTRIRALSGFESFDVGMAFSPDGATIALRLSNIFGTNLVRMDADGQNSSVLDFGLHLNSTVSYSPDGAKILCTKLDPNSFPQIYTLDADGANGAFLTSLQDSQQPSWSSDGGKIVFVQNAGGNRRVVSLESDGSNQTIVSTASAASNFKAFPVFAPDNSRIALTGANEDFSQTGIRRVNADGTNENFLTEADAFEPFLWVNRTTLLRYSRLGAKISEAGATAQIKVVRAGDLNQTTTVDYATADGTAVAGQDYTPASGSLTFAPGEMVKTFSVSITNDTVFEPDETVLLNLSNASGGSFDAGSNAVLTIVNDESAFEFHADSLDQSSPEAHTSASFRIVRRGSLEQSASVTFSTANGSADAGLDYTSVAASVIFTPGVGEQIVSVPLQPDSFGEGREYFIVRLSNPSVGSTLGTNVSTRRNIIDDDPCETELDSSFGGCGRFTTPVGLFDVALDMTIQPDGKIIVAGSSAVSETAAHFAMVRYNPDGSLDANFEADGKLITEIGLDSSINALAVQPDGKILALGRAILTEGESDLVLARYNATGALDPTFGTDGIAVVSFGSGSGTSDVGTSVAVQPDGKIVAAGFTIPFSGGDPISTFARFETDGALDTSFDGDGKLTIGLSGVNEIILQPDGKILAAGVRFFTTSLGSEPLLMRVLPNGTLDPAFDGDGLRTLAMDGQFWSIALQTDGKIVTVGTGSGSPAYDSLVARFDANGSPDPSFDGDGVKTVQLPGTGYDEFYDVAIQANGKIVAVGGTGDFYVVRLNADGSPDASLWGTNGILTTDFGGSETPYAVKIQPNGKIVAAGVYQNTTGDARFAVARYDGDPLAPTAANVSVSGRIVDSNSQGVSRATVSLTDASGNTRTVTTNSFGNYRFDEVASGRIYIISVAHKKYVFNPASRVLNVSADLSGVDFTANE